MGVVGARKNGAGKGYSLPSHVSLSCAPFFLVPKYFQAPTAMQASNEPVVLVMTILKMLYVVACVQIQLYGVLF